jgi:hypothetical protein
MRHRVGPTTARLPISICVTGLVVATFGLTGPASVAAIAPIARAAKTVNLVESAHLTFDPALERGSEIGERGQATGTYNAPVEVILTIHPHSVTAVVTIFPHGGSITGLGNANYKIVNNVGYFGGTFTLTRGTGKYRHVANVANKPLGISGRINRENYALFVKANGPAVVPS